MRKFRDKGHGVAITPAFSEKKRRGAINSHYAHLGHAEARRALAGRDHPYLGGAGKAAETRHRRQCGALKAAPSVTAKPVPPPALIINGRFGFPDMARKIA
jgi:hypothetical protein